MFNDLQKPGQSAHLSPTPYLTHTFPSTAVQSLAFCPYDDILGVGHAAGFTSLVVPGAGEANFDSLEADPFEGKRRRREREVNALLDKIPMDMITLDTALVGKLDLGVSTAFDKLDRAREKPGFKETSFSKQTRLDRLKTGGKIVVLPGDEEEGESSEEEDKEGEMREKRKEDKIEKGDAKKRARGRNSTLKKMLRKRKRNVVDPITVRPPCFRFERTNNFRRSRSRRSWSVNGRRRRRRSRTWRWRDRLRVARRARWIDSVLGNRFLCVPSTSLSLLPPLRVVAHSSCETTSRIGHRRCRVEKIRQVETGRDWLLLRPPRRAMSTEPPSVRVEPLIESYSYHSVDPVDSPNADPRAATLEWMLGVDEAGRGPVLGEPAVLLLDPANTPAQDRRCTASPSVPCSTTTSSNRLDSRVRVPYRSLDTTDELIRFQDADGG